LEHAEHNRSEFGKDQFRGTSLIGRRLLASPANTTKLNNVYEKKEDNPIQNGAIDGALHL
jgi:hypothetical protein